MTLKIALLTTGRQDWGILRSPAMLLRDDDYFELALIAGGMACSAQFGDTVKAIADEGFEIVRSLDWLADNPNLPVIEQLPAAAGSAGRALERIKPQALMLVGDRFETAAAALAAAVLLIPIIHLLDHRRCKDLHTTRFPRVQEVSFEFPEWKFDPVVI